MFSAIKNFSWEKKMLLNFHPNDILFGKLFNFVAQRLYKPWTLICVPYWCITGNRWDTGYEVTEHRQRTWAIVSNISRLNTNKKLKTVIENECISKSKIFSVTSLALCVSSPWHACTMKIFGLPINLSDTTNFSISSIRTATLFAP